VQASWQGHFNELVDDAESWREHWNESVGNIGVHVQILNVGVHAKMQSNIILCKKKMLFRYAKKNGKGRTCTHIFLRLQNVFTNYLAVQVFWMN